MDQLIYKSSISTLATLVEGLTPVFMRHLSDIHCATALVQAGMNESRKTHYRAVETFAHMVETAQQMIQGAAIEGRITPLKEEALHHLTLAYLYEMLAITDDTNAKILTILARW